MGEAAAVTLVQQIVASTTGSLITSVFMTPFDVVKIRLQAQHKPITKGHCFIYCNGLMDHTCACLNGNGDNKSLSKTWYKRSSRNFHGTADAFFKIAKNEGLKSLWSGLSPTLVMAVPATMIYFTLYDRLKYMYGYSEDDPKTAVRAGCAGCTARVAAVTVISPLELLRTKLQYRRLTVPQIISTFSSTISNNGFLVLWRGFVPTVLRDVPFSFIYWFGYEKLKGLTSTFFGVSPIDPLFVQSFLSGALSGTLAAVLTLPFDVIKTHRQIELGEITLFNQSRQLTSTWYLLCNLWRQNGLKALYAGIVPRVAKVAPACAIMISTFEYFKHVFRHRNLANRHFESS